MYVDGKFDFGESLNVALQSGVASRVFSWEEAIVMAVNYMLDGVLTEHQVACTMRAVTPKFPENG